MAAARGTDGAGGHFGGFEEACFGVAVLRVARFVDVSTVGAFLLDVVRVVDAGFRIAIAGALQDGELIDLSDEERHQQLYMLADG